MPWISQLISLKNISSPLVVTFVTKIVLFSNILLLILSVYLQADGQNFSWNFIKYYTVMRYFKNVEVVLHFSVFQTFLSQNINLSNKSTLYSNTLFYSLWKMGLQKQCCCFDFSRKSVLQDQVVSPSNSEFRLIHLLNWLPTKAISYYLTHSWGVTKHVHVFSFEHKCV